MQPLVAALPPFFTPLTRSGEGGQYTPTLVAHDTPAKKKSVCVWGGGGTSEAEREFDKVARRNEHLAADISIVLFADMWVTPMETLLASVTRSLPRLPLSGCLSVCVRACRSQTPPGGCGLEETCKQSARARESLPKGLLGLATRQLLMQISRGHNISDNRGKMCEPKTHLDAKSF